MFMKFCQQCGNPFLVQTFRFSKAKFCSMSCRATYFSLRNNPMKIESYRKKLMKPKAPILLKCPNCNKTFSRIRLGEGRRKFCSRSCSTTFNRIGTRQNEQTRMKISLAIKKLLAENPNHPAFKGPKLPPETCRKIGQIRRELWAKHPELNPMRGKHLSIEAKEKIRRAHLGMKPTEEIKAKIRQIKKEFFVRYPEKHPNYILSHGSIVIGKKGISKGQFELYQETKKIHPDAELNYPILTSSGNRYYADVCIPSANQIIEYDGQYWHKDLEKDRIRDENLRKDGWKVTHLIEIQSSRRGKKAIVKSVSG